MTCAQFKRELRLRGFAAVTYPAGDGVQGWMLYRDGSEDEIASGWCAGNMKDAFGCAYEACLRIEGLTA